jgi:hypothetical protein
MNENILKLIIIIMCTSWIPIVAIGVAGMLWNSVKYKNHKRKKREGEE